MKLLRRTLGFILACVLLSSLTACGWRAGVRSNETEYLKFRAHFVERLLETDKASQRAALLPAPRSSSELTRLSRSMGALADEAAAIRPPARWQEHNDLLVRSARSLSEAMRDFATVASSRSRDSTLEIEGTRKVVEAQQAYRAAEEIYRELTSRPAGGFS